MTAAKHDHWYIVHDDPDPRICLRCECGEKFDGFLAWSRHLMALSEQP